MDEPFKQWLRKLGARIAYIRKFRGLNQEQLAEAIEYSVSYIAKIEANSGDEPHMPSLDFLYRVAQTLNVHITKLFEDDFH